MSAAAEGSGQTTKAIVSDSASSAALKEPQKPAAALEEDDEFEDFPVEGEISLKLKALFGCSLGFARKLTLFIRFGSDWPPEDAEGPGERDNTRLWEESWDDDDTSEDFSKQLK